VKGRANQINQRIEGRTKHTEAVLSDIGERRWSAIFMSEMYLINKSFFNQKYSTRSLIVSYPVKLN